jgi:hypothetical protein
MSTNLDVDQTRAGAHPRAFRFVALLAGVVVASLFAGCSQSPEERITKYEPKCEAGDQHACNEVNSAIDEMRHNAGLD